MGGVRAGSVGSGAGLRTPAGRLALQAHDPQAERGQCEGGNAGPGPHPVDPVTEQQQDDEGDRPDRRPGQHDTDGVHLQRRRGLLRRTGHGATLDAVSHISGGSRGHVPATIVWHAVAAHRRPRGRAGAGSACIRPGHEPTGAVMPAKSRRPVRGATPPAPAADSGTPADVVAGTGTAPRRSDGPQVRPKNGLDRFFEVSARRSSMGREVRGGFTTFFTMVYIVLLNPIILTSIPGLDGTLGADVSGTVLPFPAIAAVTALIAGVM